MAAVRGSAGVREGSQDMSKRMLCCSFCGQEFVYQYVGTYRRSALMPIDCVCRNCLAEWFQRWEQQSGWPDRLAEAR